MSEETVVDVLGTSRHQFAELFLNTDDNAVWAVRDPIAAPNRPDDIYYTVKEGDRIEMIAFQYYGNVNLWWIIADYNSIPFPMVLKTDTLLRMPSKYQVEMEILP